MSIATTEKLLSITELLVLKNIVNVKEERRYQTELLEKEKQFLREKNRQRAEKILMLLNSVSLTLNKVLEQSPTLVKLLEEQVRGTFNSTPKLKAKILWQSVYVSSTNTVSLGIVRNDETNCTRWGVSLLLNTEGRAGWFLADEFYNEYLPNDFEERIAGLASAEKLIREIIQILEL